MINYIFFIIMAYIQNFIIEICFIYDIQNLKICILVQLLKIIELTIDSFVLKNTIYLLNKVKKIFAINLIKIKINDARQILLFTHFRIVKPYLIKLQKRRHKILQYQQFWRYKLNKIKNESRWNYDNETEEVKYLEKLSRDRI